MFFLVEKPYGVSSFAGLKTFSRAMGIKRSGHSGTLDPLASGLLLVATGRSTGLLPFVSHSDKTYVATMRFDGSSASCDLGEPVAFFDSGLVASVGLDWPFDRFGAHIAENFTGTIEQTPNRYSAIHIDGKRAYERARAGEEFVVPTRTVTVRSCEILSYEWPECRVRARVSGGMYIRTLADDIGRSLGLAGYLTSLERVAIGELEMDHPIMLDGGIRYEPLSYGLVFPDFRILDVSEEEKTFLSSGRAISDRFGSFEDVHAFARWEGRIFSLVCREGDLLRPVKNQLDEIAPA